MKNMKYGFLFGLAAVGLLLLAACPTDSAPSAGPAVKSDYGKVKIITAGGGTERTILPPVDPFSDYEYIFKDAQGDTVDFTEDDGYFEMEEGAGYTVTVNAYIGGPKGAGGTLVATGTSAPFNVTSSVPASVTVRLEAVPNLPTGSFKYEISYPKDAELEEFELAPWPTGVDVYLDPDTEEGSVYKKSSKTLSGLDVGSYLLKIKVSDPEEGRYAGLVEAVHILPGLTTEYTHVFSDLATLSNNAEVVEITFDGEAVVLGNGGDISVAEPGLARYEHVFALIKDSEVEVSAKTADSFAKVRFAMGPDNTTSATQLDGKWVVGEGYTIKSADVELKEESDVLFVEVTAANGKSKLYYKVDIKYLSVYTVTFNKNGGDTDAIPAAKEVIENDKFIDALPTHPTRTGYIFVGWFTEASGGVEFTTADEVVEDITVYAKWEAAVTITFNVNGGDDPVDPVSIRSGTSMGAKFPTTPTKTGYVFDGWWDTTGNNFVEYLADTPVSAIVTVTAKWVLTYGDANYEVPLSDVKVKNTEPLEAENNSGMWIPLTFPNDFDIGKYDAFTAVLRLYDSTGARINSSLTYGDARIAFTSQTVTTGTILTLSESDIESGWWNFGVDGVGTNQSFAPANLGDPLSYTPKAFAFLADGNGFRAKYMALESLSFRRRVTAATPTITTQPKNQIYTTGDVIDPLSVVADVIDGGVLSYQWYSATDKSGGTTELIAGATEATFDPPIDSTTDHGDKFYYVVVTNTNNKATTTKTTTATSDRAKITDITPPPDKFITFDGEEAPVGNGPNIEIKEINVGDATTSGGFTFEMKAGYGPFVYFKVKFANGHKLSDYSKLDFTFEGLAGDTGWKTAKLLVSDSIPASVSESGYTFQSEQNDDKDSDGKAAPKSTTIPITSVDSAIDLNEVYIAIYTWSAAATWKISGIKFYN